MQYFSYLSNILEGICPYRLWFTQPPILFNLFSLIFWLWPLTDQCKVQCSCCCINVVVWMDVCCAGNIDGLVDRTLMDYTIIARNTRDWHTQLTATHPVITTHSTQQEETFWPKSTWCVKFSFIKTYPRTEHWSARKAEGTLYYFIWLFWPFID